MLGRDVVAWPTLLRIAKADGEVRRGRKHDVMFWLGQYAAAKARGSDDPFAPKGSRDEDDDDESVKEHAVFALSQLRNGEGIDPLIEVAILVPALTARKFRELGFGHFDAAPDGGNDVGPAALDHPPWHTLDGAQLRHAFRRAPSKLEQNLVPHHTKRGAIELPTTITVKELAELLAVNPADVIRELIKSGIFATINQLIDRDTASLVAGELGYEVAETIAPSGPGILESEEASAPAPAGRCHRRRSRPSRSRRSRSCGGRCRSA